MLQGFCRNRFFTMFCYLICRKQWPEPRFLSLSVVRGDTADELCLQAQKGGILAFGEKVMRINDGKKLCSLLCAFDAQMPPMESIDMCKIDVDSVVPHELGTVRK